MFKDIKTELNWSKNEKLFTKYAGYSPHTIFDDNFEITVFPAHDINRPEFLIESFLDEFVWVYENKNENVVANLALLKVWLLLRESKKNVMCFDESINKKYLKYKEKLNKYLVLL